MPNYGLISSDNTDPSTKDMQVLDEHSEVYFNFMNSLGPESTRHIYKLCLEKFLNHYKIDLASLLKLPEDELTNLIIKYPVERKILRQYRWVIKDLGTRLELSCEAELISNYSDLTGANFCMSLFFLSDT